MRFASGGLYIWYEMGVILHTTDLGKGEQTTLLRDYVYLLVCHVPFIATRQVQNFGSKHLCKRLACLEHFLHCSKNPAPFAINGTWQTNRFIFPGWPRFLNTWSGWESCHWYTTYGYVMRCIVQNCVHAPEAFTVG